MTASALVSIVIPTMNREAKLISALHSLLEIEFSDIEIIIVDDGSSDGTRDFDFEAMDPRIVVVRHEHNRGACAARNSGIDAATAPYIAFLDSDDVWLPRKINRQLEMVRHEALEPGFIATGNVLYKRGQDVGLYNDRAPHDAEDLSSYLMISRQALQTSTILMPTQLARRIRFRDGLRRHQDWDFLLRVTRSGARLIYDHEPLAIYNIELDSSRVSLQPGRLAATLEWLKLASPMLAADAMLSYFVWSALSRDGLSEPKTMLNGMGWLSMRSPLAPFKLALKIITVTAKKIHHRSQRR